MSLLSVAASPIIYAPLQTTYDYVCDHFPEDWVHHTAKSFIDGCSLQVISNTFSFDRFPGIKIPHIILIDIASLIFHNKIVSPILSRLIPLSEGSTPCHHIVKFALETIKEHSLLTKAFVRVAYVAAFVTVTASFSAIVINGCFGALAALIHAAITPIFRAIIGYERTPTWYEHLLRSAIPLVVISAMAFPLGITFSIPYLIFSTVLLPLIVSGLNGLTNLALDMASEDVPNLSEKCLEIDKALSGKNSLILNNLSLELGPEREDMDLMERAVNLCANTLLKNKVRFGSQTALWQGESFYLLPQT